MTPVTQYCLTLRQEEWNYLTNLLGTDCLLDGREYDLIDAIENYVDMMGLQRADNKDA